MTTTHVQWSPRKSVEETKALLVKTSTLALDVHKEKHESEYAPCHHLIPPFPLLSSFLLLVPQQQEQLHQRRQPVPQLQARRLLNQHSKAVP